MKKQLKILNIIVILAIIFSTLVFTGVESFAINSQTPNVQTAAKTKQEEKNIAKPSTIPEKNSYAITHMNKTGFKFAMLKFLIAMFGVLVSCLAIFLGLKFYKKLVSHGNNKFNNIDYDKTLESPKDFKEAINLFLDKTNKS